MPYGILLTIVDILLIIHAVKSGRFTPWGYVILFLPGSAPSPTSWPN